jgi:hypothetical protein
VAKDTNAVLDMDVKSILEEFADLPDPRSHINRLHLLGDLVVICIMAVIAGAEGPRAIGLWAKSNEGWLEGRLRLPNGVPAHDTIGRGQEEKDRHNSPGRGVQKDRHNP